MNFACGIVPFFCLTSNFFFCCQGLSTTFILNTNKWNFTTVAGKGIFDESLTNSMLREKLPFRRDHLIIPRSDVGFKTLGALDHWRCIDGIGKVGAVRDRFALSLLRHTDGTFLELMHFSPGFFLFQAVPGGAVLCCDESARVRQRSGSLGRDWGLSYGI
jgi:hypothetical protein